jgi:hypothetical protein
LESLGMNPKMIFICLNKKVNEKFYVEDNLKRFTSPVSGTVI